MPVMISEAEFLDWEKNTREDFPERALYHDPRTDRTFLLYYNMDTDEITTHYVLSEGQGDDGAEILFKYSVDEHGYFQNVRTVDDFRERADELLNMADPRMN